MLLYVYWIRNLVVYFVMVLSLKNHFLIYCKQRSQEELENLQQYSVSKKVSILQTSYLYTHRQILVHTGRYLYTQTDVHPCGCTGTHSAVVLANQLLSQR